MNLVMFVTFIVVMPLVLGGMLYYFYSKLGPLYRAEKERKRILAVGEPAHAQVVEYKWVNLSLRTEQGLTTLEQQAQVELTVEVYRPGAAPYSAVIETLISARHLNQVQAGNWLGVCVDPADPQNIAIEELGARPPPTAPQLSTDAERRRALLVQHDGTEMRGAGIPLGNMIGAGIGLVAGVAGIGAGIYTTILGNRAEETCKKAAAYCQQAEPARNRWTCDQYLRASPPNERWCRDAIESYQRKGWK
jgi:hypothetical protein